MRGSISKENISFSRNCDIKKKQHYKITKTNKREERHGRFYLFNVYLERSDTLEIAKHGLFNSVILSFAAVDFISGQLISLTNS